MNGPGNSGNSDVVSGEVAPTTGPENNSDTAKTSLHVFTPANENDVCRKLDTAWPNSEIATGILLHHA